MLVSCAMRLHSGVFPDYAEKLPQEEKMEKEDSFPQRVWQIVAAIPEGSTLPWHRVVNRHGTISLTGPDLQRQRQALLAEGVMVSGSGQIDLQRYRWNY